MKLRHALSTSGIFGALLVLGGCSAPPSSSSTSSASAADTSLSPPSQAELDASPACGIFVDKLAVLDESELPRSHQMSLDVFLKTTVPGVREVGMLSRAHGTDGSVRPWETALAVPFAGAADYFTFTFGGPGVLSYDEDSGEPGLAFQEVYFFAHVDDGHGGTRTYWAHGGDPLYADENFASHARDKYKVVFDILTLPDVGGMHKTADWGPDFGSGAYVNPNACR